MTGASALGVTRLPRLSEPPGRQVLVPFDKRECISLKEAAGVAGKSESTMRAWVEEHGLGRRIGGGTWSVSRVALAMFLDGDDRALRAYHAGDRSSEIVMGCYERSGCPLVA
ncbi:hypothetical protein SAMN05444321_0071 [Bradyrhizobium lablabi]|nr:hypothetical protein SAMN05444321_0071 [Bradyrhizobium lablabi]